MNNPSIEVPFGVFDRDHAVRVSHRLRKKYRLHVRSEPTDDGQTRLTVVGREVNKGRTRSVTLPRRFNTLDNACDYADLLSRNGWKAFGYEEGVVSVSPTCTPDLVDTGVFRVSFS